MIYITGDTHGNFYGIDDFCRNFKTTKDDVLIILGDAGINYYGENSVRDKSLKGFISTIPITLFCIRGNHEFRPTKLQNAYITRFFGNNVIKENGVDNIVYAMDGYEYDIDGKNCFVIGGAYSVDKSYRLEKGWNWFEDEQLSDVEKAGILSRIGRRRKHYDVILTHTCPQKYIPTEWFLSGVDQSTVDNSMEEFLNLVEEKVNYDKWYCGHYHGEKRIDKVEFIYHSIREFNIY